MLVLSGVIGADISPLGESISWGCTPVALPPLSDLFLGCLTFPVESNDSRARRKMELIQTAMA